MERLDIDLREGQELQWAGEYIRYLQLVQRETPDKLIAEAELQIARGEDAIIITPGRHLHLQQNEWTTEVAIHSTWRGDLYAILHAGLGDGRIAVTLIKNPLMRCIWMGGFICAAGAISAAWPQARHRKPARAVAGPAIPAGPHRRAA
jgi:cytochrome c biogenesis factor